MIGPNDKLVITCRDHGDFIQKAGDHLDGHGCPMCDSGVPKNEYGELINRNLRADTIIRQFQVGMLSETEALRKLDAVKVRGSFARDGRFCGYDYGRQQWIESAFGITVEG